MNSLGEQLEDAIDNFIGNGGCLISIVLIFIAGMVGLLTSIYQDHRNFKTFMEQCQQDHKEYQCYAMWRQGETRTQVVPMPIVVSTGR